MPAQILWYTPGGEIALLPPRSDSPASPLRKLSAIRSGLSEIAWLMATFSVFEPPPMLSVNLPNSFSTASATTSAKHTTSVRFSPLILQRSPRIHGLTESRMGASPLAGQREWTIRPAHVRLKLPPRSGPGRPSRPDQVLDSCAPVPQCVPQEHSVIDYPVPFSPAVRDEVLLGFLSQGKVHDHFDEAGRDPRTG